MWARKETKDPDLPEQGWDVTSKRTDLQPGQKMSLSVTRQCRFHRVVAGGTASIQHVASKESPVYEIWFFFCHDHVSVGPKKKKKKLEWITGSQWTLNPAHRWITFHALPRTKILLEKYQESEPGRVEVTELNYCTKNQMSRLGTEQTQRQK